MAERSRAQAERAFLVQIDRLETATTDFEDGAIGRVEHIRSGEASRFGSVRELVEFMGRVLDEFAAGDPASTGDGNA